LGYFQSGTLWDMQSRSFWIFKAERFGICNPFLFGFSKRNALGYAIPFTCKVGILLEFAA
jgi:hypothetical protein